MISEVSDLQRWTVSWTGPFPKAAMFRPHFYGAKNAPAGGPVRHASSSGAAY